MTNFLSQYENTRDIFNEYLNSFLNDFICMEPLAKSIKYSLLAGGKRLRPVLMIETAKLFNIEQDAIMPLALSIEMIHTYSLIHDDLPSMDNDVLRRGMPTNHVKFGEDNAILAGDGLLNLAFETALDGFDIENTANNLNAIKMLFTSSGTYGMVGGQSIDINADGKFANFDQLRNMHSLKTGALFVSCCLCPAYLAGADSKYIDALGEYANNFGLLFQITDDILDAVGDEQKLGKSVGKDKKDNKSTYVNIFGLDKSKDIAKDTAEKAKSTLDIFDMDVSFHSGLIDYVLERDN